MKMIAVGTILFWSIVYGIFQAIFIWWHSGVEFEDFPWEQFHPKFCITEDRVKNDELRWKYTRNVRHRMANSPAGQELFRLYGVQHLIQAEIWQAVVVEVITTIVACFKVPQVWQVMNVHVPYVPVILIILTVNTIVLLVLGLMLTRARKALAEYVAKLPDPRIGTEKD